MPRAGGWRFAIAFAGGCLLAPWMPLLPGMPIVILLAAVAGTACAFEVSRLPALALLGMVWFLACAQWQLDGQWPGARAGEVVAVRGTVIDLPRQLDQSSRFLLQVDRAKSDPAVPERVLVSWYRPSERLEPGSRWQMDLRLTPPVGRNNGDGFDYQRWLLTHRIGAIGSVRGEPVLRAADAPGRVADRQRQRLADIFQSETTGLDEAALKRALAVADRSAIRPELAERLRQTGTAHLLAISGLHVGMVAGLAGLLASWLAAPLVLVFRRLDRRRLGVIAGLAAALGYAALAGFTLPTQRALVMLAVLALALLSRRAIAPGHALLLALVAVLLFDPLAPLASGFWLSFAAVAVLVWAFAWRPAGDGRWLSGLLRAQLVIMIGLLPLSVGLFGQFVPVALLANLVAIPLVGLVILPALLFDIATILLGWPASLAGTVAEAGLRPLLAFLEWAHGLPHAFVPLGTATGLAILSAAAGALWLLAPPGWPARWLGVAPMLPLLWPVQAQLQEDELEVWFMDVGEGLAVLMSTAGAAVLYDSGPGDGEGGDVIGRLLPGLLRQSGASLDRAILSHRHRAHAGGVGSILQHADKPEIVSAIPGLGQACRAGQQWRHGAYRFEILHPSAGLPDLGANSSCVLRISGPGGSVLLTGGIDAAVEARLVSQYGGPSVDILQLPAGGHRRGTSRAFLEAVAPRVAIISTARFDRFDRPHEETLRRLEAVPLNWYATGECGAIRVRLRPGEAPAVHTANGAQTRFWRRRSGCP